MRHVELLVGVQLGLLPVLLHAGGQFCVCTAFPASTVEANEVIAVWSSTGTGHDGHLKSKSSQIARAMRIFANKEYSHIYVQGHLSILDAQCM